MSECDSTILSCFTISGTRRASRCAGWYSCGYSTACFSSASSKGALSGVGGTVLIHVIRSSPMHDMLYGVAPAVSRQTHGGCVPRLISLERLSSRYPPGDCSLAPHYVLTWACRSTDNVLDET